MAGENWVKCCTISVASLQCSVAAFCYTTKIVSGAPTRKLFIQDFDTIFFFLAKIFTVASKLALPRTWFKVVVHTQKHRNWLLAFLDKRVFNGAVEIQTESS